MSPATSQQNGDQAVEHAVEDRELAATPEALQPERSGPPSDAKRGPSDGLHAPEAEADPWQAEEWIDEGIVRDEAEEAVRRGTAGRPARGRPGERSAGDARQARGRRGGQGESDADAAQGDVGDDLGRQLTSAVGRERAVRYEERLDIASQAFRRGRYEEARRLLKPVAESVPGAAVVRELHGLTLYRLGRWKQAVKELEAFRTLTGSVEQHPVLADSYRALGHYDQVEELWDELRSASPSAPLVAEGRIVAAGALADQGRVGEAIALLEPGVKPTRRAKEHHLRVAYALADLYERAGDLPRARELFQRVAASDPDFVDVEARLRSLA